MWAHLGRTPTEQFYKKKLESNGLNIPESEGGMPYSALHVPRRQSLFIILSLLCDPTVGKLCQKKKNI